MLSSLGPLRLPTLTNSVYPLWSVTNPCTYIVFVFVYDCGNDTLTFFLLKSEKNRILISFCDRNVLFRSTTTGDSVLDGHDVVNV